MLEDRIVLLLGGGSTTTYLTSTLLSITPSGTPFYGTSLTITATVNGDPANGGSVTFDDGQTALKTVPVSGQSASFVTSSLAAGSHSITAHFSGYETGAEDSQTRVYESSTSKPQAEMIKPAPLTITANNAARLYLGPDPSLTVSYAGFVNGETSAVLGGTPTIADTTSPSALPGTYAGAIVPSGWTDSNYAIGYVDGTMTVNQGVPTTTTLTPSAASSVFGQPVTYTATVSAGSTPSGWVQFLVDGANYGAPVALGGDGTASFTSSTLPVASHTITADFYDSTRYESSAGQAAETVAIAGTTTSVTPSVASPYFGQPETFTAAVSGVSPSVATPSGLVQFVVDGANSGSPVTLDSNGKATLNISSLALGSHTITADFLANSGYEAGSGKSTVDVSNANTTTTVSSSSSKPDFGSPVTFAATVSGGSNAIPSGSIQFQVDGVNSGSPVSLSDGLATLTTSALASGPRTITAIYSGDSNFNASQGSTSIAVLPGVISIDRSNPGGTTAAGPRVVYAVTFSESVTGVAASDFHVATTGTVTASSALTLAGSGSSYLVTVAGISGSGTLQLDLTSASGIVDAIGNGLGGVGSGSGYAPQVTYAVGQTPVGIATADLNGDGLPDIVVANHNSNNVSVLLNEGNGTFAPAVNYNAGSFPDRVAVMDTNGDGIPDIVAMDWSGTISVLLGKGDGTFSAPITSNDDGTGQTFMAVADLNGDGKPDLVTTDYYGGAFGNDVNVLLNNGNGTFSAPTNYGTSSGAFSVAIGDVNGDGLPDLVTADWDDRTADVFINQGNGTFAPEVSYAIGYEAGSIALADFNGDGHLDIVASNSADGTLSVLLNKGNGTFAPQTTIDVNSPGFVTTADINGDGNSDIVLSNFTANTVSVLQGNGNGTFAAPVSYAVGSGPEDIAVADLNGDGLPDIAVPNRNDNTVSVLLSQGAPIQGQIYSIEPPISSTTTTISAPSAPFGGNAPVTITVSAAGGTPTGDVTLSVDGGAPISELLSNGSATFNLSGLSVGNHALVASYAAQANFLRSSANGTIAITQSSLATSTVVTASASKPAYGQSVTFTATVSASPNAAIPTGLVQFQVNGVDDGSPVDLTNGMATLTTSTLPSGPDTITAFYAGDASFTASQGLTAIAVLPAVISIDRFNPGGTTATGPSVIYLVTFSEAVTGVLASDFRVLTTGTVTASPTLVLSGGGAAYQVTVAGIGGAGTLELELVSSAGIVDASGNGLPGSAGGMFAPAVTYAAGSDPAFTAIGDINGDGLPDLVASDWEAGTVLVYRNLGNGTFAAPVTYDAGPHPDPQLVDVNGDGKLDIVAMNWDGTVSVLMNEGNGTFAPKVTYNDIGTGQTSMAVVDLNGDGKPDLVTTDYYGGVEGHDVSVMMNLGNGTFGAPTFYGTSSGPFGVAVADLNGDGKPDIVTSNWDTGTISVLMGNGDGTFQPSVTVATAGDEPGSIAVADLNHDGKPDLVVGNYADGTVSVLMGNGDGTFQPQVTYDAGYNPSGVSLADLNGDGNEDIIVANQNDGTASVLMGNGDGTFAPPVTYSSGDYQPNGVRETNVAVGDLNGDGLPDLVTADRYDNTIRVLLSQGSPIQGQIYAIAPSIANTTIAISAPPAPFGGDGVVSLTVVGSGGTSEGLVSLSVDGGTPIPQMLSGGTATFDLSGLSRGNHSLVASYAAQGVFLASSATGTIQIGLTATTVSSSDPSPVFGEPITFTATVSSLVPGAAIPAGSVQFLIDGVDFGSPVTPSINGTATLLAPALATGPHTITAEFEDGQDIDSTGTLAATVSSASTTTTLSSPVASIVYGQTATFTATVSAGLPSGSMPAGSVQFLIDGVDFGSPVALDPDGRASLVMPILHAGSHGVSAVFVPSSASFAASDDKANAFALMVTPASLTITANDQTSVSGSNLPALSASYSGFVNGDSAAGLATPAILSTTATLSSLAGTYPISAGGASSPDYTILFVPGTLTIEPMPVTVDPTPVTVDPTPAAVVPAPVTVAPVAVDPSPTVEGIQVVQSEGSITRIVVQFGGTPDSGRVGSVSAYRLALGAMMGRAMIYNRALVLKSASYDANSGRVTLTLRNGVAASSKLQLTIAAASGLAINGQSSESSTFSFDAKGLGVVTAASVAKPAISAHAVDALLAKGLRIHGHRH